MPSEWSGVPECPAQINRVGPVDGGVAGPPAERSTLGRDLEGRTFIQVQSRDRRRREAALSATVVEGMAAKPEVRVPFV